MDWRTIARLALLVIAVVMVIGGASGAVAANVAETVVWAVMVVAVADTVYLFSRPDTRRALAEFYASSLGGRLRASTMMAGGFAIVSLVISAVIAFLIVAKLFPTLESAASDIQTAASNSNNTLIKALAPVIPYLIGAGLFIFILIPLNILIDGMRRRFGIGQGAV